MSGIQLLNRHLVVDAAVAGAFFPGCSHVSMVYYPATRTLMLAPAHDELFKSLHKTSLYMVKDKNLKGDKAISVEELLIDHEQDAGNRSLAFEANTALGIISIYI